MSRIELPRPLAHQVPILTHPARHGVVVCGRKFGKTTLGLVAVIDGRGRPGARWPGAARGAQGAWVAPSYPIASDIWRDLKVATRDVWTDKSEVERRIEFPGGGSVTVRSADNPDSLRGPNYHFVVVDEAALLAEEAWTQVLRPTLAATGGWSLFLTTPKGQNWFYTLFQRASVLPGWAAWQRPTSDNPRVPADEIEAARVELGSYVFAQEYLAEFVTPGGGLFKREHTRRYTIDSDGLYRFEDGSYSNRDVMSCFSTVDTATSEKQSADYTAIATWGVTRRGRLCLLDLDMRRLEGPAIVEALKVAGKKWQCVPWIEATSQSAHLLAFLETQSVAFKRVEPGAKDKFERALPASAMHERGDLVLPTEGPDFPWLSDYERQLYSFAPNSKAHDDAVDVTSYAAAVMTFGVGALPDQPHVKKRSEPLAGLVSRRPPPMT